MDANAIAKNVKGSPQKAKLVIDLIRGLLVNEALAILQFTNKRSAHPIERLLRSAIANAEQKAQAGNISVDVDELWVKECYVGKGVTKHRRRVRPAPMGRAYRERRHYSHITITVSSDKRESGKASKQAAKKPAAKTEIAPETTVE
ncbi:MAG: 50S ribosomal protein L22 [Acidobacteriota bacterium]